MPYKITGKRSKRGRREDLTGNFLYKTLSAAKRAIRSELKKAGDERMIWNPRISKIRKR